MPFYKTYQILGSVGVKANHQVKVADSSAKTKVRKPSAAKLKAMGYTAAQRKAILDAWQ